MTTVPGPCWNPGSDEFSPRESADQETRWMLQTHDVLTTSRSNNFLTMVYLKAEAQEDDSDYQHSL